MAAVLGKCNLIICAQGEDDGVEDDQILNKFCCSNKVIALHPERNVKFVKSDGDLLGLHPSKTIKG